MFFNFFIICLIFLQLALPNLVGNTNQHNQFDYGKSAYLGAVMRFANMYSWLCLAVCLPPAFSGVPLTVLMTSTKLNPYTMIV